MLSEFHAASYRSLRRIRFPVGRLGVFVGANGVGKTNLYRALQLLQAAAAGTLSRELAAEGGMESALWAGERDPRKPVRMTFGAGFAAVPAVAPDHGYDVAAGVIRSEVRCGVRTPTAAAFPLEPQIKEETVTFHYRGRTQKLLERRGPAAFARDDQGVRQDLGTELMASETALGSLDDPGRFPDLYALKRTMLDWRFYHEMRTDLEAPLRRPCLAVASPTLASDGSNLAAVLATLVHIREDTVDLDRAIEDAFPGATLEVPVPGRTASFGLRYAEHARRVFEAAELSDGTLRYIALVGALLAYRLPAFVALNEPETSIHPDLLEPLARLIARASERTQIWLVTHSERLASALSAYADAAPLTVIKRDGETWIEGLKITGEFRDEDDA